MDYRVCHGMTSELEKIALDYIKAHIDNGRYIGRLDMLEKYQELRDYNSNLQQSKQIDKT